MIVYYHDQLHEEKGSQSVSLGPKPWVFGECRWCIDDSHECHKVHFQTNWPPWALAGCQYSWFQPCLRGDCSVHTAPSSTATPPTPASSLIKQWHHIEFFFRTHPWITQKPLGSHFRWFTHRIWTPHMIPTTMLLVWCFCQPEHKYGNGLWKEYFQWWNLVAIDGELFNRHQRAHI